MSYTSFLELCECGCGKPAPIATQTRRGKGHVKGQPMRFCHGHASKFTRNSYKTQRWTVEDHGYETPCWDWLLAKIRSGHGHSLGGLAHRIVYEEMRGAIPAGKELHHLCENPACVNPDHLVSLTLAEHRRAHAKLTWDDVEAIRSSSEGPKALALRFGVSVPYICNIRAGRAWKAAA